MQLPQLGARLHADLVDQRAARVAVGLKRLRLAAGAIQREHPQAVQALAQRLLPRERVELGKDVAVAPGGEVGLDRLLARRQPQLLEPADLQRRERLAGDVVERRSAP